MPAPSDEPALAAELARLESLAEDATGNLPELEHGLSRLIGDLGARLRNEHVGPARMYALRAERMLPAALYREGLASLASGDHARAEELLSDAARRQEQSVQRLRGHAEAIPSLRNDAEESARLMWTMRWETSKALRGLGRWRQAQELLTGVLDAVRTDGRFGLVRRDLELVTARVRQEDLRNEGHGVRAALRGLGPDARRASRPGITPEGFTALTGNAPRVRTPFLRPGRSEPRPAKPGGAAHGRGRGG
ncbi:hypothetical protein [Nocardiopsis sp. CA-288880]|uniref:hypothetical protein n=1 Tax=Nocardiopsis sp. CA-288880 TaxID=3239995 RepID=UPI003D95B94E